MNRERIRFAFVALVFTGSGALAQEPTVAGDRSIEEIIVTGSHIRRADLDGPIPVVVLNREDLDAAGFNTLPDLARNLTYNSGTVSAEFTGTTTNAPGANFFDLRGLGAQSTLTLVNGRRIAPYASSAFGKETFVDINSIPMAAVERIEILKDGASAIYGADAVAGVVNLVLKDHHNGLTVDVGALSSSRGDAEEYTLSVTAGHEWEKTSALVTASYLRREPMLSADRGFLADADLRGRGGFDDRSLFSTPATLFRLDTNRVQPDPACPMDVDNPLAHQQLLVGHPFIDGFCRFNFRLFMPAIPETERAGITAVIGRQLSDNIDLKLDLIVNHNDNLAQLAPALTDITPLQAPFPLVPGNHPNNPFGAPVFLNYRVLDAGPRIRETESWSSRASAGLEGELGGWQWSAHGLWSLSDVDTANLNNVDSVLFQNALFGLGGPNGDQFYNPFGLNPTNDPQVIAAFSVAKSIVAEESREWAAEFQLSRTFGRLPGGALGLAIGVQIRDQSLEQIGDEFQTSGVGLGTSELRPLTVDRDVNSMFAELALPVLSTLEIQLAARLEDYSDFGSDLNPKIALRWQATPFLALRGSYSTSFRAPTFKELFRAPNFSFFFAVDTARCAVTGAPLDCERAPFSVERGGNASLQPEEGESMFAGLVLTSEAMDFQIAVDFWRFDHTDRIVTAPAEFILDNFGGNPELIQRSPALPGDPPGAPGPITLIRQIDINLDRLVTAGIDTELHVGFDRPRLGRFDVTFGASYLDEYSFRSSVDPALQTNLAGGAELDFPLPRFRSNSVVSWARDNSRLSITTRYSHGYRSPIDLVINNVETETPVNVRSHTTLDIQYQRTFTGLNDAVLRLGCQNCTDRDPPRYNYLSGAESLHDPRGALVYLRWIQPIGGS